MQISAARPTFLVSARPVRGHSEVTILMTFQSHSHLDTFRIPNWAFWLIVFYTQHNDSQEMKRTSITKSCDDPWNEEKYKAKKVK